MNLAAIELWALRSLAILAALGLVAWRIYAAGERHIQTKWDTATAQAKAQLEITNARNKLESTNRQNEVILAEAAADKSKADAARYRREHPITGSDLFISLFGNADGDFARTCAGAGDAKAIATCAGAALLQAKTKADSIGRRLDDFGDEVESLNDNYRTCLATRPKGTATAVQPPGF